MTPFPLPLSDIFGHWGAYIVYLFIGVFFGVVLEIAGFGNSTKLAAQFYFKEMTVLKVMFTAIVVAMILIFAASALGILDYNLIWVNPTYLWPGILGGLIMGVGFIIGGFCPGTSLVAVATLKLDGIFFTLGVLFGIFVFGESVGLFEDFWYSSYMGRLTFQDLLGVDAGVIVLAVALMALFVFWGAEQLERIIGKHDLRKAPKWRYGAAGGIAMAAFGVLLIGQPTTEDRWLRIAGEKETLLTDRIVQISPAELLSVMHDNKLEIKILDVRPEADFNQFHILDAQNLLPSAVMEAVPAMQLEPANTVFVVVSNDETAATNTWKTLVAESVPNVYILEGGVNGWLDTFADESFKAANRLAVATDDHLHYRFDAALGERHPVANPNPKAFELAFTPKIVLQLKRGPSGGGCG